MHSPMFPSPEELHPLSPRSRMRPSVINSNSWRDSDPLLYEATKKELEAIKTAPNAYG